MWLAHKFCVLFLSDSNMAAPTEVASFKVSCYLCCSLMSSFTIYRVPTAMGKKTTLEKS